MTATLSLRYKAPTRADQVGLHFFNPRDISTRDTNVCPFSMKFVVMKTELVELKGRKALVAGRVEALDGTLLVEAE